MTGRLIAALATACVGLGAAYWVTAGPEPTVFPAGPVATGTQPAGPDPVVVVVDDPVRALDRILPTVSGNLLREVGSIAPGDRVAYEVETEVGQHYALRVACLTTSARSGSLLVTYRQSPVDARRASVPCTAAVQEYPMVLGGPSVVFVEARAEDPVAYGVEVTAR